MNPETLTAFLNRLPELDGRLRAIGINRGADAWLAAHDLLLALARQDRLPDDPIDLAPLLTPILCKSREQQERFGPLYREWWDGTKPPLALRIEAEGQARAAQWAKRRNQFYRNSRLGVFMLVLMLLSFVPGAVYHPPQTSPIKEEVSNPLPPPLKPIANDDNYLPLPKLIPPEWTDRLALYEAAITYTPWGVLAVWLVWRYWRRIVVRREAPDGESLLNRLNIDLPQLPFGTLRVETALHKLRLSHWLPTRRLDAAKTAQATAHRAGWFTPRYRQRRSTPEYLVLIHSQHTDDHSAALADELVRRFQSVGITVQSYRFHDGPQRLVPSTGENRRSLSLAQVRQRHGEARLLLVGDLEILFHPLTGKPRPWAKPLAQWTRRVWLNTGETSPALAESLTQQGFCLLPLAEESLPALALWLETDSGNAVQLSRHSGMDRRNPGRMDASSPHHPWNLDSGIPCRNDEHALEEGRGRAEFPPSLAQDPLAWLDPHPPYGASVDKLLAELQAFFCETGNAQRQIPPNPPFAKGGTVGRGQDKNGGGETGLLLLQALAFYPEPHWTLSLGLDALLFPEADADEREGRLLKIARLPWPRHAFMPSYLREALLRRLSKPNRRLIRDAYAKLLQHIVQGDGPFPLNLRIATPAPRTMRRFIADLLRRRRDAGTLDDPIFVNILLGKGLGRWDFQWPRAAERLLPGGRWVVDFIPALLGILLAGLAVWGGGEAWQRYGRDALLMAWWQANPQPEQVCDFCPKLVRIPGGEFMMGSPADDKEALDDEKPQHKVKVADFSLGKYEVTKAQFAMFSKDSGYQAKGCWTWDNDKTKWADQPDKDWRDPGFAQEDNHPVACVSFEDAQAYIQWLNRKTGQRYRLPTEAEWEYACRSRGLNQKYCGGDNLDSVAWYSGNAEDKTHPVGTKTANALGLYDMSGNLWEWTCSAYTDKYEGSETKCASSGRRAVRGGAWSSEPYRARSASRGGSDPAGRSGGLGFRLAQD